MVRKNLVVVSSLRVGFVSDGKMMNLRLVQGFLQVLLTC